MESRPSLDLTSQVLETWVSVRNDESLRVYEILFDVSFSSTKKITSVYKSINLLPIKEGKKPSFVDYKDTIKDSFKVLWNYSDFKYPV